MKVCGNVLGSALNPHSDLGLPEEGVSLPQCVRVFTACHKETVSLLKRELPGWKTSQVPSQSMASPWAGEGLPSPR